MTDWALPRAMDDFEYRGIDTVFLENEHLRVMVLPGKGGDVLEFRDKRTDVDVLWHAEHNWQPPSERPIPSVDPTMFHDHYPGGWQVNLPVAGYTEGFYDVPYGLHGESALLPFEYEVREGAAPSNSNSVPNSFATPSKSRERFAFRRTNLTSRLRSR